MDSMGVGVVVGDSVDGVTTSCVNIGGSTLTLEHMAQQRDIRLGLVQSWGTQVAS